MAFQQQGTGFTNLNRVVSANKDNRLGSTIQQGIQSDVNNTKANLQKAQEDFNNKALGQNLQLQNQQKSQQGAGVDDVIKKATTEPNKVTAGDVSAFEQYRKGDYSGPTQLANFSSLQQQGQNVDSLGKQTASAGGQFNLLRQYVGGNRNYTQGQQGLDNIILGQTGQAQLADARNTARNVNKAITGAGTQAAATAGQIASGNQAFANDVNSKLNAATGNFNADLQNRVQDAQRKEESSQQLIQRVRDYLSGKDTKAFQSQGDAIQALYGAGLVEDTSKGQLDALLGYNQQLQDNVNAAKAGNWAIEKLASLSTRGPSFGWLGQYGDGQGNYRRNWNTYNPLDFNQSLAGNLSYAGPQNLTAQGVANEQQAAALNALADLSGKQREFNTFGNYKAGGAQAQIGALADALAKNNQLFTDNQNFTDAELANAQSDIRNFAPQDGSENARYANLSLRDAANVNSAIDAKNQAKANLEALRKFLANYNKDPKTALTNPVKNLTKF